MTHQDFLNEDLELFAEHLGLDGIDADLFYESYYQLKNEDIEEWEIPWELTWEVS